MQSAHLRRLLIGLAAIVLVSSLVGPALASPAPVSGCPPCSSGFVQGAASHGLDTEVQHSEATVQVHRNDSATWTVSVVPTNETVLTRLGENRSLARAVAADSFGVRYGTDIDHELLAVEVANGSFVMRYRTHDVGTEGPFGTQLFTYFRDSPGGYVYTDLGADEVTVVAPDGTTVAQGFGNVSGDRMTATELPGVQDGPFVVFAPEGSVAPGLLGPVAIATVLWDVVLRNLLLFVALPAGVVLGGLAGIRRVFGTEQQRDPTRAGGLVAAVGVAVVVATLVGERAALPTVTGNLLVGGVGGAVLVLLGASVATTRIRRHLTVPRIVGGGLVLGVAAAVATGAVLSAGSFHRLLAVSSALLPAAVGLGWADAEGATGQQSDRLFLGLSVAVGGALLVSAPLTALGGTLFLLAPVLLTVAGVGVVVAAVPLYLLGVAGGNRAAPDVEA